MEENCSLSNCNEHEVLSFGSTILKVNQLRMKVSELFAKLKLGQQLTDSLGPGMVYHVVKRSGRHINSSYDTWFSDGIECEILKLGASGWQKGRIRIALNVSLEFCPDKPEENLEMSDLEIGQSESPLDDIRLMIKNV
ncbi:MAG: hypothetical protein JOZ78_08135 [Chroococcidiopsidaceae cyanobacterium CP_BM_ER_R8_30]|nr:hypothetical protein [Chroococcidiopsidaceae cyanobacterium CP_BM_ER_R8_30]